MSTQTLNRKDLKRIMFNAWSVRRLQAGKKTQTRRVIKLPDWCTKEEVELTEIDGVWQWIPDEEKHSEKVTRYVEREPKYQPSQTYLVAEPLERIKTDGWSSAAQYEADEALVRNEYPNDNVPSAWRWERDFLPSIFCPKWACRYTVTITDVRVERLQEISEEDVAAEGLPPGEDTMDMIGDMTGEVPLRKQRGTIYYHAFAALWDSIHGEGAWDENPWLWVYEFDFEAL